MTTGVQAPEVRQQRYRESRRRAEALRGRLEQLEEQQGAAPTAHERTEHLRALSWVPYDEQRKIARSTCAERGILAGRQVGKSDLGAYETLRIALAEPGSYSVLLAPSYPVARTAIDKMRALCRVVPGCEWKEQQKRMAFANGSVWQVFSADRGGEVGRGPTLTGLLWVDEASMVSREAWMATLGSLSAVARPRKLLTTTPKGKNWVWEFTFKKDLKKSRHARRLVTRFPTSRSPFANLDEIADLKALMTPEMAAQEFEARFVDSLILAFRPQDVDRLWTPRLRDRSSERGVRIAAGLDLGKDQDWTVLTVMNMYGETRVVDRWQHVEYPDTEERVREALKKGRVEVVAVDVANSAGDWMATALERWGEVRVLRVKTNVLGAKREVVEQARADVQHSKITIERPPASEDAAAADLAGQLEHELRQFQGTPFVSAGVEYVRYEGPQVRGEHDDCVISFALANWAREHGWDDAPAKPVVSISTLNAMRSRSRPGLGGGRRGRYTFLDPRPFCGLRRVA